MEHPRGIANAARIHGHIDDLLLDVGCLACVAICQEKCAPAPFETLPTAIPLLALPRHAMAHNIRALTVGAVKHLKNHESTLVCWSFSTSRPRIEDSRSTPLKHLPDAYWRRFYYQGDIITAIAVEQPSRIIRPSRPPCPGPFSPEPAEI